MADSGVLTIRQAIPADLTILVEFVEAMAIDSENVVLDHETVIAGVSKMLDNPQLGGYLIAEIDGQPAGSLMTQYEWSDWRAKNVIWIHSVYVHPDFRRRGIFRAMYEHLHNRVLNDNKLAGLRLYVDKTNPTAIASYEAAAMTAQHYHLYEWLKPDNKLRSNK